MPPATPRKSCLAPSSSSESDNCSSPTDSVTSTTATPPTPSLESSPFHHSRQKSKKSVRFANPIREYQLVAASVSVVVPAHGSTSDALVKSNSKKRKECQRSPQKMCRVQQTTQVAPCHRTTCSAYTDYAPPLLPPPDSPLPRNPRKKDRRSQSQALVQAPPAKKQHMAQVDVHLTFNVDSNGEFFAYPAVPSLSPQPFTYEISSFSANLPQYPNQFHWSPPPYTGAFHEVQPQPRQLRRKPSFELHRTPSLSSASSSSDSRDSLSFAHLQNQRGRPPPSSSSASSDYSLNHPGSEILYAEQQAEWNEDRHFARIRRQEMDKRRARERKPRRMDLGDGLYGSNWSEQAPVPVMQLYGGEGYYPSFGDDQEAYF